MIREYADPVEPQFLEVDLPTTTGDGVAIEYQGATVTMTIRAWLPDGTSVTWSTDTPSALVTVLQVEGKWVARHTYAPAPSELPFMRDGKGDHAEYLFDVDLIVDGVPIQVVSFRKRLYNHRAPVAP